MLCSTLGTWGDPYKVSLLSYKKVFYDKIILALSHLFILKINDFFYHSIVCLNCFGTAYQTIRLLLGRMNWRDRDLPPCIGFPLHLPQAVGSKEKTNKLLRNKTPLLHGFLNSQPCRKSIFCTQNSLFPKLNIISRSIICLFSFQ